MEHEHPATAPLNSDKILVIDDEKILEQGLGSDIHVADIPGVMRSVVRRTGVAPSKLAHVLDSIRTRFEMARSLGATSVKATTIRTPARLNLASDLAKLNADLASVEVPEVEFDSEAKRLTDECVGYTASKTNWMKSSATEVKAPKEPLENLYSQCLRVVKSHGAAVLLLLCLATCANAQAPMGAGATSGPHLRRPHLHRVHSYSVKSLRGHFHRQR